MISFLLTSLLTVTPAPARFDSAGRSIGAPLSDRTASYVLEARYEPSKRHLTGTARLTWTNRSDVPQPTLWFHAYWNAFKNAGSTFARGVALSSSARSGTGDYRREDWGYMELRSARLPDGTDVRPTLRWERPDDGNADDQTVFTLTLPSPVPPHGTVTLDLAWEARVPKLAARTGVSGKYTLFGQWFPKVGVLEVPPQRGVRTPTWNCHQFHVTTEFYADFGTYDASLTVPRTMVVAAAGVRTGRTENPDGTVTHRFHQDDIIDFAWTAWEGAVEVTDVFRSEGLPEVALTAVVPPDARATAPDVLAAAKATLEHGGRHWLPYPYPHLTLVAPPLKANADSGGMEYPTFVTVYSRTDPAAPRDMLLWEVTVHEIGHNWWQSMLASNEFEEAWLDEGIDTWATAEVLDAVGLRWNFAQLAPAGTRWLLAPFLRSSIPDALRPPPLVHSPLRVLHHPAGVALQGRRGGGAEHLRPGRERPGDDRPRGGAGGLRPHHAHLRRALGIPPPGHGRLPRGRLRGVREGPQAAGERALPRHRRARRCGGRPPLQAGVADRRSRPLRWRRRDPDLPSCTPPDGRHGGRAVRGARRASW